MNRREKEDFVQYLKDGFSENKGLFLVGYKGLKVAQVTRLRKQLLERGGIFQVAKVTLIKRAVGDNQFSQQIEPFLKDQIALVFSGHEPSNVAKVLQDFSKQHNKLSIIAGKVEDTFLNAQDFAAFVTLPSREVLLAQLCGVLNAPTTNFAVVLKMLITRLALVLHQVEQHKAKASE